MLAAAIESEVTSFIHRHDSIKTDEGQTAVVINGYLPERAIQTGLGDIEVKVPKYGIVQEPASNLTAV